MCQRSWVRIPAPYTEWTFSHVFVVGIVMAGYHINWIGFDLLLVCTEPTESNLVKQETSRAVILPLWLVFSDHNTR